MAILLFRGSRKKRLAVDLLLLVLWWGPLAASDAIGAYEAYCGLWTMLATFPIGLYVLTDPAVMVLEPLNRKRQRN